MAINGMPHTVVTSPADNSKRLTEKERVAKAEAERQARNENTENWEYVDIPETDLFGDVNNGISINFVQYGPGRHYVNPEIAAELRRMIDVKLRAEMRVLQPGQDQKMLRQMANWAPQRK